MEKNITVINIIFSAGGVAGTTRRSFLADDINFFKNPRVLTVTQEKVFTPADSSLSGIEVCALVRDDNIGKEGVILEFKITHEDASSTQETRTTDSTGEACIIYDIIDVAEIAEITVEEQ